MDLEAPDPVPESQLRAGLAERDAIKSRDLIRSPWYQQHWPHVQLKDDVSRASRYQNTHTGYRIATSVGGEGTGEGGDILIIDVGPIVTASTSAR